VFVPNEENKSKTPVLENAFHPEEGLKIVSLLMK
jgi:hypothetical protein